jgi:hypothetical protein
VSTLLEQIAQALFILANQKPPRGGVKAPRTGRHRRQDGVPRGEERRADKRTIPAAPTRFRPHTRRSERQPGAVW